MVCPTLLASTGNRTPDILILSPTPYPLGHMLFVCACHLHASANCFLCICIHVNYYFLENGIQLLLSSCVYGGGFVDVFPGQIHSENDYQIQQSYNAN